MNSDDVIAASPAGLLSLRVYCVWTHKYVGRLPSKNKFKSCSSSSLKFSANASIVPFSWSERKRDCVPSSLDFFLVSFKIFEDVEPKEEEEDEDEEDMEEEEEDELNDEVSRT